MDLFVTGAGGVVFLLFLLQLIDHVLDLMDSLFYLCLRLVGLVGGWFWRDAELHRRVGVLFSERDLYFGFLS